MPAASRIWDTDLDAAFSNGHEAALAEVYRQLAPLVHALAARALGNRTVADDVTQEGLHPRLAFPRHVRP